MIDPPQVPTMPDDLPIDPPPLELLPWDGANRGSMTPMGIGGDETSIGIIIIPTIPNP